MYSKNIRYAAYALYHVQLHLLNLEFSDSESDSTKKVYTVPTFKELDEMTRSNDWVASLKLECRESEAANLSHSDLPQSISPTPTPTIPSPPSPINDTTPFLQASSSSSSNSGNTRCIIL